MDEGWIEQMGVDSMPNGRHQPFYNVLGDDGSSRYAAQGRKLATPVYGTACTPGANCGVLRIQGHHLFDFWFYFFCLQGQYGLDVYSCVCFKTYSIVGGIQRVFYPKEVLEHKWLFQNSYFNHVVYVWNSLSTFIRFELNCTTFKT